MNSPRTQPMIVRFGPYTANLESGELWKDGVRVKLQIQPFQVLAMLLERPNELVTREQLQHKVWSSDTFVDFDQGLNKAMNKLREALGDTANAPQYIETVPRRGYRFIGTLAVGTTTVEPRLPLSTAAARFSKTTSMAALVFIAVVLLAVLAWRWSRPVEGSFTSVAVLPLSTEGLPGDYNVADGMTDSIINNLALVPGLRVISHASVFQYRGKAVDPRTIGKELKVSAVLTGRLAQVSSEISLALELTATADGRHIWGQQFTRNISGRAALQEEAASAVAKALQPGPAPARRQKISRQNSTDAEAQLLYFKARYYFFREDPEDVLRARGLFQDAINRDPTFALAYAGLGDTYDWMATEGFQPLAEVQRQAIFAKSQAKELNPDLAEVQASLASLEFVQWNWSKAEADFQKALSINPNYFEAHRLYSIYLRTMRRFPEAIQHAKLCDELNPLLMPAKSHLALTYYYWGQWEAAAEQYRLILKDHPEAGGAHAGLSNVLFKMGKEKEALQEWQKALAIEDAATAQRLVHIYETQGMQAARDAVLRSEIRSLDRLAKSSYVSPIEYAFRYALLNDKENAFLWLEKAYADHSPQLFNVNVDPDYASLRSDRRFADLLARMHLPQ